MGERGGDWAEVSHPCPPHSSSLTSGELGGVRSEVEVVCGVRLCAVRCEVGEVRGWRISPYLTRSDGEQ